MGVKRLPARIDYLKLNFESCVEEYEGSMLEASSSTKRKVPEIRACLFDRRKKPQIPMPIATSLKIRRQIQGEYPVSK